MNLRRARLAAAVGLLTVLPGALPAHAAEEGSGTVSTQTEAWHYETITPFLAEVCDLTSKSVPDLGLPVSNNDPCVLLPSSNGLTGAVSIFTKNTLHVAKIAGTPVAATYLELDMFDEAGNRVIPEGAEITGGTLTMPVAPTELAVSQADIAVDAVRNPASVPFTVLGLVYTAAALVGVPVPALPVPVPVLPLPELPIPESPSIPAGYVEVENARLVACPISVDFFTGGEASLRKPPEMDCAKGFAEAKYHGGPKPKFTVDLDRFASAWKGGKVPALAIIPARATAQETDSWIVSFWSKNNRAADAKPITAELNYTASSGSGAEGRGGLADEAAFPSGGAAAEPPVDSLVDAPAPQSAAGPAPDAAPQAAGEPEQAPFSLLNGPWYAYGGVIFLPLAFLVALGLTGHSLTKRRPLRVIKL